MAEPCPAPEFEPPAFAPEFIDALAAHAHETLLVWAHEHAPPDVYHLVVQLDSLFTYRLSYAQHAGRVPSDLNRELPALVQETINTIVAAGGSFYAPFGRTNLRIPQEH